MHSSIEGLIKSLNELSQQFNSFSAPHPNLSVHGWKHAAFAKEDFIKIIQRIIHKIEKRNITNLNSLDVAIINSIPGKIEHFKNQTFPYVFNGHGNDAIPAFFQIIEYIDLVLSPYLEWASLEDNSSLPPAMALRLQSLSDSIDGLVPDRNQLEERIELINQAFNAATALPTNIALLRKASEEIRQHAINSEKHQIEAAKIFENLKTIDNQAATINERSKIVLRDCEETLHIATSKSLAGSFQDQVNKLERAQSKWTITLAFTLLLIAALGTWRGFELAKALSQPDLSVGVIIVDLFIALSAVGAPLWFAWIATKQVKQLFRLTEDYRYKVAVSRAYEGFRKAAKEFDTTFAERLFASALNRVDESPLRLFPEDLHASPLMELLSNSAIKKVVKESPEKLEKIITAAISHSNKSNQDEVK